MAGKIRHLKEGKGLWYTRMRVPADVQQLIGKKELMRSLGGDRTVAHRLHAATVAEFQDQIDAARRMIDPAMRRERAVVPRTNAGVLDRAASPASAIYKFQLETADASRFGVPNDDDWLLSRPTNLAWNEKAREVQDAVMHRIEAGFASDDEIGANLGWAITDYYGERLQRGSPEWQAAAKEMTSGVLKANKKARERAAGNFDEEPLTVSAVQPVKQADLQSTRILCDESRMTLVELLPAYQKGREVSDGTMSQWRASVGALDEVTGGSIPAYQITRDHMRDLRRLLTNIPANATKRFPKMTLREAVAANARRREPFPAINPKTAAKWLGAVNTILGWCVRQDFIPDSPGDGMVIEIPKTGSTDGREPFNGDDLKRIFDLPGFKGTWGEDEWAYVVALYTGERASEIAQLTLAGIRREQDVLVFNVSGRLKNAGSVRKIPVHSDLLRLGLQKRIDALQEAGEKYLFPNWHRDGVKAEEEAKRRALAEGKSATLNQYWPRFIPKRFNATVRKHADIGASKVFHSFRHTFKTGLSVCGVPKDMRDLLAGHTDSSAGAAYVHGHSLVAMSEAIEKLRFDGIDIEVLAKVATAK